MKSAAELLQGFCDLFNKYCLQIKYIFHTHMFYYFSNIWKCNSIIGLIEVLNSE